MTEHETVPTSSGFISQLRNNPWMVSTFVLGILFLVMLFISTGSGASISTVSEKTIGEKVLVALNQQTGGGVTLGSVVKEEGLYKITVNYQGDVIPLYSTLDGKKLAFQVIPLDGQPSNAPNNLNGQPSTEPITIDAQKIANAPVKGDINAPVTTIEFSDYQCPFCERFYNQTLGQISEYIKTGEVKLLFMDFPLSFHDQAQKAAEAARCYQKVKSGSDVAYFQYHDKLFENQASLSEENFKKWAVELGANSAQFATCLDSGEFADEVQADMAYGQSLGVSGTPGFFVNGVEITGAQPFASFKQIIDAELAKL